MDPIFGAMIGAAGNLIGGLINSGNVADANRRTAEIAQRNFDMQNESLHHGLQLRAEDAIDAYHRTGIHPLTMLGVNPASASVVGANFAADNSLGNAVGNAGQELGRAVSANRDVNQRTGDAAKLVALQLESARLDNEIKRAELLSRVNRLYHEPGSPPPAQSVNSRYLIDGQGSTPVLERGLPSEGLPVKEEPGKREATNPVRPWQENMAVADLGFSRTHTGWAPTYSKSLNDRLQDEDFMHVIRNKILPAFSFNYSPPFEAPKGYHWFFHPLKFEYQLIPNRASGTAGPWRGDTVVPIPGRR